MKRILSILVLASSTAFAGGVPDNNPHPNPVPTSSSQQGQGQDQDQGQLQGQTQGQLTAVKNSVKNDSAAVSGSLAGSKSNSDANANSKVGNVGNKTDVSVGGTKVGNTLNAGDTTVNNVSHSSTFIPSSPATVPTIVQAHGNNVITKHACGPLQAIKETTVNGKYFGFWSDKDVDLGVTQSPRSLTDGEIASMGMIDGPYKRKTIFTRDENNEPQVLYHQLIGHEVTLVCTNISVAGGSSFSLGGSNSSGSGFGSGAANGAISRQVCQVHLVECDYGTIKPTITKMKLDKEPPEDKAVEQKPSKKVVVIKTKKKAKKNCGC